MKIHEYQAKALLAQYGIAVPRGDVAYTAAEAKKIAAEIGVRAVVKAQVYAGGRGKAGGIKTVNSPEEAEKAAGQLIGTRLVTHQTGPQGVPVSKVLVEEASNVARELYISILVDGVSHLPVMMASEAGGMEIEEVAQSTPEKILKSYIDPAISFQPFQGRKMAYGISLNGGQMGEATRLMTNLYRLFMDKDCSLAEINPLVVTADGKLLALDAKLNFDDNALYRHKDIQELQDKEQEEPLEIQARDWGINNYVKMDGDIGCMVNGAGLAMAVNDLIQYCGGRAANFLDIGTLNNTERVVNSFKMFVADHRIRAVLVNIFGGMARVDVIAKGIVEAYQLMTIPFPVVIRLAGTNLEEGQHILAQSGMNFIQAKDFYDGARKVVEAAKGVTR
ncbi:MAG: ADP-forming succinate--CoA ligase subunit beta [Dehalococcoidia bacterium]|nr:ADP-forming succinate--CoA ligase subunit beta [Dehalococcoidia bacterium]MDH4367116.1 ADP-forming succinate--CoA ligase subunit beta [Dehalococcoidia bacterium]